MSPRRGKENDRPGPPVSDEGGVRQPKGRTNEQASGASAGSCGRDADCVNARDPVRPSEARPLRERATERKAEGPRQSPRSACLPTARSTKPSRPCGASAGFLRSRSRPQRPRTGSPNVVRSAGTGKRESTFSRRDGPVAAQRSSGASRRQEGAIHISPVPGASKRSEVAPGTGRLQRTKPEGRGGLAAQRESADGPEAEGSPLGRTGAGEDRLRRRREALPRRRTQPQGWAGDGWRDACRESQDMAAQPVMSCAKLCRRHDSRKRVRVAGFYAKRALSDE